MQGVRSATRGDTIVETVLAFAIFGALVVTVTTTMNRSIAAAQRSLEITLVRQQIDSQADLLRYARDNELPAWQAVKDKVGDVGSDKLTGSFVDGCPEVGNLPASAFFMYLNTSDSPDLDSTVLVADVGGSSFTQASYVSEVDYSTDTPESRGMWVVPVWAEGSSASSSVKAYDMYIRTCWDTVGQNTPLALSTIVRLYDH